MMRAASVGAVLVLIGSAAGAEGSTGSAPSFRPAGVYAVGTGCEPLAHGDLNGDKRVDLAVACYASEEPGIRVLLNNGRGHFMYRGEYLSHVSAAAIGDLNGDGAADLAASSAVVDDVPVEAVLMNRGDGSFLPPVVYRKHGGDYSVAIGDFDRDGHPDLVVDDYEKNAVSIRFNRGDGRFGNATGYGTGRHPRDVAIGDLNGDGSPDLVTANEGAHTVSVLINRGDGTFRAKRDYRAGKTNWSVAIGDLDGDGKPDLLVANGEEKTVSVLLNRRGRHVSPQTRLPGGNYIQRHDRRPKRRRRARHRRRDRQRNRGAPQQGRRQVRREGRLQRARSDRDECGSCGRRSERGPSA